MQVRFSAQIMLCCFILLVAGCTSSGSIKKINNTLTHEVDLIRTSNTHTSTLTIDIGSGDPIVLNLTQESPNAFIRGHSVDAQLIADESATPFTRRLKVDTGADSTIVFISLHDAKQFLDAGIEPAKLGTVANGTPVYGFRHKLSQFKVGTASINDFMINFAIYEGEIPSTHQGLLGTDFLYNYAISIDTTERTMHLRENQNN